MQGWIAFATNILYALRMGGLTGRRFGYPILFEGDGVGYVSILCGGCVSVDSTRFLLHGVWWKDGILILWLSQFCIYGLIISNKFSNIEKITCAFGVELAHEAMFRHKCPSGLSIK